MHNTRQEVQTQTQRFFFPPSTKTATIRSDLPPAESDVTRSTQLARAAFENNTL